MIGHYMSQVAVITVHMNHMYNNHGDLTQSINHMIWLINKLGLGIYARKQYSPPQYSKESMNIEQ
jgi:hypothetical protein